MSGPKKAAAIAFVIYALIVGPIWFYLLYKILRAVQATELMMFLYWIYLPLGFVLNGLAQYVSAGEKK